MAPKSRERRGLNIGTSREGWAIGEGKAAWHWAGTGRLAIMCMGGSVVLVAHLLNRQRALTSVLRLTEEAFAVGEQRAAGEGPDDSGDQ
jgi:hypothetical protein